MYEMIELVNGILPKDKPRYLMGVGTPVNILEGIERGVDMFDCVMPTRNGRNGMLFTKDGIMNMRNKKWEMDFSPIEADGASYVDTMYSKAYLRHLFHAQELLAMQIASIHNLAFYLLLAGEARKHIIAGDFATWKPMMVKRVSTIMRKMNWRIWKNIKLPRGKFLKRLDWYIIKKFLGTYVFAIALIISIAVVFDFNEKMDRFMSHEAPWNAIVFDYYLNFIPYFANLFSPLFVFIAVIFFTSKLAENSEIIAMFSTGMSFKRMLRPYMVSAAIIAVVTFCFGSYVIPKGSVTRINF